MGGEIKDEDGIHSGGKNNMTYCVTLNVIYEADSEKQAMEKTEAALQLIPKGAGPVYYEVHFADKVR